MPEVGDQIEVAGTKVDQAPRRGVVTDVAGRMLTVQWATGDQSVFVPAPGTLTVLGRADAKRSRTNVSARASRSARGAIPVRPSTTRKKKAARQAPARKTAKKGVAKRVPRKAPVRKTAKKRAAKKAARKAPVRKTAKKRAAKKTARKAPVRHTAKKRVAKKAARKRVR